MDLSWPSDGLDVWFQEWVEGFVVVYAEIAVTLLVVVVVVAILRSLGIATVRRNFWCHLAGRDVEVEFERHGPFRALASVRSCTAFEDSAPISCRRRCVDANFRRQWEPALPVVDHRIRAD